MAAIKTQFDNPIEQDVALELINNKPPAVETTLKNAENVYKSFLYLRKMYSMYPQKNTILKANTVNYITYTKLQKPENGNYLTVNNLSTNIVYLKINDDEFGINVGQMIDFPIVPKTDEEEGDKIELKGKLSYMIKAIQEI